MLYYIHQTPLSSCRIEGGGGGGGLGTRLTLARQESVYTSPRLDNCLKMSVYRGCQQDTLKKPLLLKQYHNQ